MAWLSGNGGRVACGLVWALVGWTGCDLEKEAGDDAAEVVGPSDSSIPLDDGGWDSVGGDALGGACEPGDSEEGAGFGDDGAGDDGAAADGLTGGGDDGGEIGDGGGGADGGEPFPAPEPGQLTAGQWSDLDNWAFFRDIAQSPGEPGTQEAHWSIHTAQRVPVIVSDGESPIADARVQLLDGAGAALWEARTDNRGRAELFAGLDGGTPESDLSIEVSSGDASMTVPGVAAGASEPITIALSGAAEPPGLLDLMFVVDTTGSMGDELTYLQAELDDVISRVKDSQVGSGLSVRLSVDFYRDCGDEYVVRSFPFTEDIDQGAAWLGAQASGGGGDFPEAVERALHSAIDEHEWSESARARLLFLVLDAPPHHSPEILATLQAVTRKAATKGIRIIPVASSGVDVSTEMLLRLLAVTTGGSYTFLTDHSGIGNDHLEPTIGAFEVELLNEMLVRIIAEAVE